VLAGEYGVDEHEKTGRPDIQVKLLPLAIHQYIHLQIRDTVIRIFVTAQEPQLKVTYTHGIFLPLSGIPPG
jgi:hypothetical protein